MNYARVFLAGVTGGAVMSLFMAVGRAMKLEFNLEMILGTLIGLEPGVGAWLLGLLMHLVISGLIGLAYGELFLHVRPHRAGLDVGLLWSLLHTCVTGVFLWVVPYFHPLMPEAVAPPGAFLINQGASGVFILFLFHFIYGAVVGTLCVPLRMPHMQPMEGVPGR